MAVPTTSEMDRQICLHLANEVERRFSIRGSAEIHRSESRMGHFVVFQSLEGSGPPPRTWQAFVDHENVRGCDPRRQFEIFFRALETVILESLQASQRFTETSSGNLRFANTVEFWEGYERAHAQPTSIPTSVSVPPAPAKKRRITLP